MRRGIVAEVHRVAHRIDARDDLLVRVVDERHHAAIGVGDRRDAVGLDVVVHGVRGPRPVWSLRSRDDGENRKTSRRDVLELVRRRRGARRRRDGDRRQLAARAESAADVGERRAVAQRVDGRVLLAGRVVRDIGAVAQTALVAGDGVIERVRPVERRSDDPLGVAAVQYLRIETRAAVAADPETLRRVRRRDADLLEPVEPPSSTEWAVYAVHDRDDPGVTRHGEHGRAAHRLDLEDVRVRARLPVRRLESHGDATRAAVGQRAAPREVSLHGDGGLRRKGERRPHDVRGDRRGHSQLGGDHTAGTRLVAAEEKRRCAGLTHRGRRRQRMHETQVATFVRGARSGGNGRGTVRATRCRRDSRHARERRASSIRVRTRCEYR